MRIAKQTATEIPAAAVIFIDSSNMGFSICSQLNAKDCYVISNNPGLLSRLSGLPHINSYCTGGLFDREAQCYVGRAAADACGTLKIDTVILTPDSYSPKHGAGYANMLEAEFITSVIPADAKVIIAIPSKKVGHTPAFFSIPPTAIKKVITDEAIHEEMATQIGQSGVCIEIV